MSLITKIRLEVDNKDAKTKIREVAREQDSFVDKGVTGTDKVTNSFGKLAVQIVSIGALYKGIRAIQSSVNKAIDEFAAKEMEYKRLENAINLTGESYDRLSNSIKANLWQLQQTTRYSDNETAGALQTLTILTGDYAKANDNLMLVLDMASSGLFDINTAAKYVSMAIEGNYTMLGRYIPQLRKLDDQLGANATEAEKTAAAMQILNDKFSGLAVAELDTYNGRLKVMENNISDLRASMGGYIQELGLLVSIIPLKALEAVLRLTGNHYAEQVRLRDLRIEINNLTDEEILQKKTIAELDLVFLGLFGELTKKQENKRIQAVAELKLYREILSARQEQARLDEQAILDGILLQQNLQQQSRDTKEITKELHNQLSANIQILDTIETNLDLENKRLNSVRQYVAYSLDSTLKQKEKYQEMIEIALESEDLLLSFQLQQLMAKENLRMETEEVLKLTEAQSAAAAFGVDAIYSALDGNFKNIGDMFLRMIKRMIAEALILAAIMKFTGVGSAGVAGFGSGKALLSIFGRADGGNVSGGTPYMVGERGKELFVPKTDGYIVPNTTTNNMIDNGGVEKILQRIETAIYRTALDDTSISRANERGSEYRRVI